MESGFRPAAVNAAAIRAARSSNDRHGDAPVALDERDAIGDRVTHRFERSCEVPVHRAGSFARRGRVADTIALTTIGAWRRGAGANSAFRGRSRSGRAVRRRGPRSRPTGAGSRSPRSANGWPTCRPRSRRARTWRAARPRPCSCRSTKPTAKPGSCSSSARRRCRRTAARSRSRAASTTPVRIPTCAPPRCARRTRRSVSPPDDVEVVARLDGIGTVATRFTITPFVGFLPAVPALTPSPGEVVRILHVRLSELLDPDGVPRGAVGHARRSSAEENWATSTSISTTSRTRRSGARPRGSSRAFSLISSPVVRSPRLPASGARTERSASVANPEREMDNLQVPR